MNVVLSVFSSVGGTVSFVRKSSVEEFVSFVSSVDPVISLVIDSVVDVDDDEESVVGDDEDSMTVVGSGDGTIVSSGNVSSVVEVDVCSTTGSDDDDEGIGDDDGVVGGGSVVVVDEGSRLGGMVDMRIQPSGGVIGDHISEKKNLVI